MARSSVGRSRSSSNKLNKLNNTLKKNPVSTNPSLTLLAILSDLRLSYNLKEGTLEGDSITSPPNLDNLSVLKKSLNNLKSQLEKVIAEDDNLLQKIGEQLSNIKNNNDDDYTAIGNDEVKKGTKRTLDQRDEISNLKEQDIERNGKEKITEMEDKDEKDGKEPNENGEKNEEENEENKTKEENEEDKEDEEEEDDDDELLQPKKKRSKIESGNSQPFKDELKDEDDDDIPLASVKVLDNNQSSTNTVSDQKTDDKMDISKSEHQDEDEDENQEEYHTPEGDTRVKNPKSEFVTAQTLPAAAALLGLYSEETGGLDQTGEEYLKRKYAVASYPTRDLQDMLPGPIPDIDFSKSKPSNQVQFSTFQGYTDVYFRPYTEDDIKVLKEKYTVSPLLGKNYDPLLHPFLIPKLGPLYSELWAQEEPLSGIKLTTPSPSSLPANAVMLKGSADQLTDELLETDSVSCGPLVTRLLSALIPDEMGENRIGVKNENDDGDDSNNDNNSNNNNNNNDNNNEKGNNNSSSSALEDQQGWNANIAQADYSQLEQRLRRELKYVGVYMNVNQSLKEKQASLIGQTSNSTNVTDVKVKDEFQEDWISGREDDEICTEMRSLQRELSQLVRKNNKRKQILIPLVEEQIAWQEYMSILDDLDKQIDQAYLKRMRVPKKLKKRGHTSQLLQLQQQLTPSAMAAQQLQQLQQAAANSGLKSLLDKRSRWINKIGPLFKPNELMRRFPKVSVFKDVDLSKDEDENYDLDDGTSGINNNNATEGEIIDEGNGGGN